MPPPIVQVDGLRQTVRALEQAGASLNDLKDVMAGIAAEARDLAAGFAPVRSGKLRASIRGNRAKGKAVVNAGSARVRYAGPINYGWPKRGIRPNGFLQRVDPIMKTRAPELLEKGIAEILQKLDLT